AVARRAATVSDIVTTSMRTSSARGPRLKSPSRPFLFLTLIPVDGGGKIGATTRGARDGLRDGSRSGNGTGHRPRSRRPTPRGVREPVARRIGLPLAWETRGDERIRDRLKDARRAPAETDRRGPPPASVRGALHRLLSDGAGLGRVPRLDRRRDGSAVDRDGPVPDGHVGIVAHVARGPVLQQRRPLRP